jgi:hypothetical protein
VKSPLIVNFARYEDKTFVLSVASAQGAQVNRDLLTRLEFIIEVSQYPFAE